VSQTAKKETYKNKKNRTVVVDRAAEAFEKLTDAYRAVDINILALVNKIKVPSRTQIEGLKAFVLFVNALRENESRWPVEYLSSWSNLTSFTGRCPSAQGLPSTKEVCLELQKIKKIVTRPYLANLNEQTF
jgi:hypothetical protein